MKVASWCLLSTVTGRYRNLSHEPLAYGSVTDVEYGFVPDAAITIGQENHDRRSTMHVSVLCFGLFCSRVKTFQYSSVSS